MPETALKREAQDEAAMAAELAQARSATLRLVEQLSDWDVKAVHSPLMSPLAWDLGHIGAFEDLWLRHRLYDEELLRPGLAEIYDAFETPRAHRGELEFLSRQQCLSYLSEVRESVLENITRDGVNDPFTYELVLRHELQHTETMRQTLTLAALPDYEPPAQVSLPTVGQKLSGLETVTVPSGPFALGAGSNDFAYDNERPAHTVELDEFEIGIAPVTNGAYEEFVAGGGYEHREWWSDAGWQWHLEEAVERPLHWRDEGLEQTLFGVRPRDPHRPVAHISYFEAEAFVNAHGVRLPSETEWEKAARFNPESGETQTYPWDETEATATQANLGQHTYDVAPVGAYSEGVSPCGAYGMLGDLWEWTASEFSGYPGFSANPYREYSEVFFDSGYRVLRGGSWATSTRVASTTFRNWDYPQRRQIFAGLRIAR